MGKVMAAAIDLDIAAAVAPREDDKVVLASDVFAPIEIDLSELNAAQQDFGTSAAIVRGVAAGMRQAGLQVGGFEVYEVSDVLKGSGMSSSAAFEILICTIFNYLYNLEYAIILYNYIMVYIYRFCLLTGLKRWIVSISIKSPGAST